MMGLGALVLKLLLEYFESEADGTTLSLVRGLGLVLLLLLPTLVSSFCLQHSDHVMVQLSIQARAALVAEIYKKTFDLSNAARQRWSHGEIANLVSVDVQRLCDTAFFINWMYGCPLVIVIVLALLVGEVGMAVVPGIGLVILSFVVSHFLSKVIVRRFGKRATFSDERLSALQECLAGIKTVKLYGWEKVVIAWITGTRDKELEELRHMYKAKSASQVVMYSTDYGTHTYTRSHTHTQTHTHTHTHTHTRA
jgi:ABC-type bacteriocin/lantibiotic exporter with double-glycine peptidase domain